MIYVMSRRTYKQFRTGKDKMTHNELIHYINATFGLRGTVTKIRVEG
jgi:hypothetical protein